MSMDASLRVLCEGCVCAHVGRAGGGWASECVREHNDVMKDDMGFGLGAL